MVEDVVVHATGSLLRKTVLRGSAYDIQMIDFSHIPAVMPCCCEICQSLLAERLSLLPPELISCYRGVDGQGAIRSSGPPFDGGRPRPNGLRTGHIRRDPLLYCVCLGYLDDYESDVCIDAWGSWRGVEHETERRCVMAWS